MDDIAIAGDDQCEINNLKAFLGKKFGIKDLGPLRYFLGIEVAKSKNNIFLSQCKYVLDLLQDSRMLDVDRVRLPIESNHRLQEDKGHRFIDIGHYKRLVGKLIYLTLTRPNISYEVGVVSQFIHASTRHLESVYRILRNFKKSPCQGFLYG